MTIQFKRGISNKIFILLFFAFINLTFYRSLVAQPPLETLLHLDKSFYVSGETVWFKLYLPFTWEGNNVAVNTSIIDGSGNLVDQFFLKTKGHSYLSGYFQISYDQKSDYLEIQFSASGNPQSPVDVIAHYSFPVYNDLNLPSDVPVVENPGNVVIPKLFSEELSLTISMPPGNKSCRENLEVIIDVKDENGHPISGHASVSIKDASLAGAITGDPEIKILPISYTIQHNLLRSTIYSRGHLFSPEGETLQMNVLGAYVGADEKIYYSKSFQDGSFQIDLPDFTGEKVLQLVGFQYEQPNLSSVVDSPMAKEKSKELIYTRDLIEYLELSRLRKKIYQYYDDYEANISTEQITVVPQEIKPDARYRVKEYESFKDMKSFFGELLTPLRFKMEKDSSYKASLFNAKGGKRSNTILNGPPLFIIDGKMTRDADFVARLPISAVETVELFLDAPKLRGYFQAIGVSGVVKISTSIANLKLPQEDAGNIHRVHGLQPEADFPYLDPDLLGEKKHQPFFRPQLYWKPDLEVSESGSTSFTFTQSDDSGLFEIQVVFQAKDGRRASKSFTYQVAFQN